MIKDLWSRIDTSTLIIVGILASAISFIYYFGLKNPSDIILWIICIIDFLLLVLNSYYLVDCFELTKWKAIFFTALTVIGFLVFCECVVFGFTAGSKIEHTFELFFDVLRIGLFLAPSFILLLPIIYFIAGIMS